MPALAAYHVLSEGDHNASDLIAEALSHLRRVAGATEELDAQAAVLESAVAQLLDAAREVRSLAETVEANPARLTDIDERIAALRRLKRKYGSTEGRGTRVC